MSIPPSDFSYLSRELAAGERLVWSGRPSPFSTVASKLPLALFGLVFFVISEMGIVGTYQNGRALEWLLHLMFGGVSLFVLAIPLLEYGAAQKTIYVITDQRLIIARTDGRSAKSIRLSGIRQVERLRKRGKTTIRIPTILIDDGEHGPKVGYTDLHGLFDGERAYKLLTQLNS